MTEQKSPTASFGNECVRDFLAAYFEYLRAISTANIPEQVRGQLREAQQSLADSLRDAAANWDYQKYQLAGATYWRKVEELSPKVQQLGSLEEARDGLKQAYRSFLNASQDAWAKLDVKATHPPHLAVIANILAAGALLGTFTVGWRS